MLICRLCLCFLHFSGAYTYAGCVGIPGAGVQEEDLSEGPESTPQQIQPGNCLNGLTFKTIIA